MKLKSVISKYISYLPLALYFILAFYILYKRYEANSLEKERPNQLIKKEVKISKTKIDLKIFLMEVEDVKSTDYFDLFNIFNSQYVKGSEGVYFALDLKDSISKSILYSPAGEYTFEEDDWKVKKALDKVNSIIFKGLLKNIKYKVYLEGQADSLGDSDFNRYFIKGYEFRDINYFPYYTLPDDKSIVYNSIITSKKLIEPLYNKDLPLLRSSYLFKKLTLLNQIPTPILLEGKVVKKIGDDYRNGKILIFVDSENFSN